MPERHLVWVCAGCEKCQEESTDGVTPGAPIPHDSPCTDTSPSMNGAWVIPVAGALDELLKLYQPNVPDGNFLGDAGVRGGNVMLAQVVVRLGLADEGEVAAHFKRLDDQAYTRQQRMLDEMNSERRS